MNLKSIQAASALAAILLLTSCQSTADPKPAEQTQGTDAQTTETAETEPAMWADIPQTDLNQFDFRFLESECAADTGATLPHGDAEEINGNVINDAIYNRNRAVEDYFNCIIGTKVDRDIAMTMRSLVFSGDTTYSAILGKPSVMVELSLQNNLLNLNAIDTIHPEKPWYNQAQVDSFTVKDKLYVLMGDLTYSTLMFGACLIYNVDLAERLDIPDIYDIIMDGKWTLDTMYEITSGVSRDLNGDGVFAEDDDQFAYAIGDFSNLMNYQYSSDMSFIRYDEKSGTFLDTFNVDRMSTLVGKMNSIFYAENRSLLARDYTALFNSGRTLMRSAYVGSCINHRDMDDTFTPIPYPKFDEAQDGYRSMMTGSVLMLGIPTSVTEEESVGMIAEALSEYSAGAVNDAAYETVLSYQTMRTEKALDILHVLHDSLIVDYGYLSLNGSGDGIRWVVGNLVKQNSTDVASYYAKYINAITAYYDGLLETYAELN